MGQVKMTQAVLDLVLECVDTFRVLLKGIEETKAEPELLVTQKALAVKLKELSLTGQKNPPVEKRPSMKVELKKSEYVKAQLPTAVSQVNSKAKQVEPGASPVNKIKPPVKEEVESTLAVAPVNTASAKSNAPSSESTAKSSIDDGPTDTVRIHVGILDNLMNLTGELVLIRNQLLQHAKIAESDNLTKVSHRLNVLTSELQTEVMKTRMQPVSSVLTKFYRVVRDTSKSLGKKIELILEGAETELDKTIIEAVKDPLTHIVRNSVDHGFETPDVRKEFGKSDTGRLLITSFHESGQVVIRISDDGKGLDVKRIKEKALEKGLVTAEELAKMSDKESFRLIFEPGFSTASQVSNLSGRGVGMDVVRTNIEKIGGTVEVTSERNVGTSITLRIPLTLAILPALTIKSEGHLYAIPQNKIIELIRLDAGSGTQFVEELQGRPVLRLRGEIFPLVKLSTIFGVNEVREDENVIVLLSTDRGQVGLMIHDIEDSSEIVVKPLHANLSALSVYTGATIMGSGAVALILDVNGIAQRTGLEISTEESKRNDDSLSVSTDVVDFIVVDSFSDDEIAIPMAQVKRLEEFAPSQVIKTVNGSVVKYRGALLPVIDITKIVNRKSFDTADLKLSTSDEPLHVVVVSRSNQDFGFLVKKINDVISSAEIFADSTRVNPYVEGKIISGDDVYSILDVSKVITDIVGKGQAGHLKGGEALKPHRAKHKILVAEDSLFFRNQLGQLLTDAGYGFEIFEDGEKALTELMRDPKKYSLVVSDIEMPRMNGLELVSQIRSNNNLSHLPAVAVTTRFSVGDQQKGIKAGFTNYLEKLNGSEVLSALDSLLKVA